MSNCRKTHRVESIHKDEQTAISRFLCWNLTPGKVRNSSSFKSSAIGVTSGSDPRVNRGCKVSLKFADCTTILITKIETQIANLEASQKPEETDKCFLKTGKGACPTLLLSLNTRQKKPRRSRRQEFSRRPLFTSKTRTDFHAACTASPIRLQMTYRQKCVGKIKWNTYPQQEQLLGLTLIHSAQKRTVHTLVALKPTIWFTHTSSPSLGASRMRSFDGSGARRVCWLSVAAFVWSEVLIWYVLTLPVFAYWFTKVYIIFYRVIQKGLTSLCGLF